MNVADENIIKALQSEMDCAEGFDYSYVFEIDIDILKNVLDLINRQKAEIERLNNCVKTEDEVRAIATETIQAYIKTAKSEVIKEFAERLKEKLSECRTVWHYGYVGYDTGETREIINNLVNEMTEG